MEKLGAGIADFEDACESALLVQGELLTQILLKNSDCEYLQRFGAPTTLETFKSKVPVVSYDDIAQYIQRVADGSTEQILCTDPILQFARSSGTSSGSHKIVPQSFNFVSLGRAMRAALEYRNRALPLESGNKATILNLYYAGEQHKTKSGLLIGALSTNFYKSEAYINKKLNNINETSPPELVAAGCDWRQTTYCHLLCGLLQRHKVDYIDANFAYTICEVMRLLKREWEELCQDISSGTLNAKVTDETLRRIVTPVFHRELENQDAKNLADEIFTICSNESWDGIIPLLFPRAKYLHAVITGAMEAYVPALKRYAGGLPLVAADYGSSEGLVMGLNINPAAAPEDVVFTLIPFTVFYEFLPVDGGEESIVGIDEVEVGKLYELVITNTQGLYRYKVGDVLEVVGFFKQTPQVVFRYRKNALLSITTEKVDEQELQKAVLTSFGELMEVANFTSYADFETELPPHYVIFCELTNAEDYSKQGLLQGCCNMIDRSFTSVSYFRGRVNKTIGRLELVMVKQGCFEKLMEVAVLGGASPGQYKTPRCVTTPALLKVLRDHKVCGFRSSSEIPSSFVKGWEPSFPRNTSARA